MSASAAARPTKLPTFLYGTAWKEERTEALTRLALTAGFRGIDTANQRKHYFEAGVGAALAKSGIQRDELFLQTKFTYARGQDQRLPFDPKATLAEQVRQSFESSLTHLGVTALDSLLLHGPWSNHGWSPQDREAWGAMQELSVAGRVRFLGVSNVSPEQLTKLCDCESTPPMFVQNRCYARAGWDREVRAVCRERGIIYQGFSLLTANRQELSGPLLTSMARRYGASVPQLVFRFALSVEILPLTGTSDAAHMAEDLASPALALEPADVASLLHIAEA